MTASLNRRRFLQLLAAVPAASTLSHYHALAAPEKGRVKIRDLKMMTIQGRQSMMGAERSWTFTLVKVETDAGLYGIGEVGGLQEQVHTLKPTLIGKDPLEIDVLYVDMQKRFSNPTFSAMRPVSGIEIALWDLAGKILGVPTTTLLGGKFRDRVRMYHDEGPRDMLDPASCREWAQRMKAHPAGWTAFKFGFSRTDPAADRARDRSNRLLTSTELSRIRKGFENCREALGWNHDIIVHCHWEYDLRTSIQLAEAIAPIRPLWLEDPMPPDYSDSWRRLVAGSPVPICTGENLGRRQGFKDFLLNQACDVVQLDIRNTGGLLESKRIADLADVFSLPLANHNTGSIICTMATIQWAASIRDYLACETIVGENNWMDNVLVHDGPIVKNGHIELPNKPGLGLELNPDVVKAHLAPGERYWS